MHRLVPVGAGWGVSTPGLFFLDSLLLKRPVFSFYANIVPFGMKVLTP